MRRAIFCFLLFCAFEAIFADQVQETLDNLRKISDNQLHGILRRLCTALQEAHKAASEKKGMTPFALILTGYCFKEFEEIAQMEVRRTGYFGECDQCHDKAARTRNIKAAKKCCIDIIAAFEDKAKSVRADTKECISQYVNDSRRAVAEQTRKGLRKY